MSRIARTAAAAAIGYAVGSVPVGVLVGRVSRGIDVRDHGSHSMGTTNVLRTAGRGPALATLLLDIGKGAAAARIGGVLGGRRSGMVAAGLGAVVGHSWPVFARFHGGKSSAVAFGTVLVASPPVAGAALLSGVGALAVSRRMSLLSLVGAAGAVVTAVVVGVRRRDATAVSLVVPGVAIVVLRHRENINRLLRGVEPEVDMVGAGASTTAEREER